MPMCQLLFRCRMKALLAIVIVLVPASGATAELQSDIARALKADGITGAVWGTLDEHGQVRTEAAGLTAAQRTMRPDLPPKADHTGVLVLQSHASFQRQLLQRHFHQPVSRQMAHVRPAPLEDNASRCRPGEPHAQV